MPAYYLEALTVALGLILLMAEAFSSNRSKAWIGGIAAVGLTGLIVATFFAVGPETGYLDHGIVFRAWTSWPLWNFYHFDGLARFYKLFALFTTLLVVLLSIDFRSVLAKF